MRKEYSDDIYTDINISLTHIHRLIYLYLKIFQERDKRLLSAKIEIKRYKYEEYKYGIKY